MNRHRILLFDSFTRHLDIFDFIYSYAFDGFEVDCKIGIFLANFYSQKFLWIE